jgi:hypothetical protein
LPFKFKRRPFKCHSICRSIGHSPFHFIHSARHYESGTSCQKNQTRASCTAQDAACHSAFLFKLQHLDVAGLGCSHGTRQHQSHPPCATSE